MKTKKGDTPKNRKAYFAKYNDENTSVRITFPNSDYKIIEQISDKQGLQVASFIRYATLSQAKNLYLFPKELEDQLKLAVRNMRSIGNNINQIAKYTNQEEYASRDAMETIFNYLLMLEKEIKNIKQIVSEREGQKLPKKYIKFNPYKLG